MNPTASTKDTVINHTTKTILARGCDPAMSEHASRVIPPMIGNPEYVWTTTDADFVQKLKTQKWSVIFFAPGACRYNAAHMPIPGGNEDTKGWTLDDYKTLILELQGEDVVIVETQDERETVGLLKQALDRARTSPINP